jgi:sugar/nucleoside kinase (ribokinase family)
VATPDDTIVPICPAGEADHAQFVKWLSGFSTVDPSGVYAVDGPTNRMDAYAQPDGTRTACAGGSLSPIPFERIRKSLPVDAILVNMTSGNDITLDTLDALRMEIRGKRGMIHFDFHNLTTRPGDDRQRVSQQVPEWRRWAFMLDSVQMNEEEISVLPIENLTEEQTVGHLSSVGVRIVTVTRGAAGLTVYTAEHKKITKNDVTGPAVHGTTLPRAPGDMFGAVFLYHAAGNGDPVTAARRGAEFVSNEAVDPIDRLRR